MACAIFGKESSASTYAALQAIRVSLAYIGVGVGFGFGFGVGLVTRHDAHRQQPVHLLGTTS